MAGEKSVRWWSLTGKVEGLQWVRNGELNGNVNTTASIELSDWGGTVVKQN